MSVERWELTDFWESTNLVFTFLAGGNFSQAVRRGLTRTTYGCFTFKTPEQIHEAGIIPVVQKRKQAQKGLFLA